MNRYSILALLIVLVEAQNLRATQRDKTVSHDDAKMPVISDGRTFQEYMDGVARVMVGAAYRVYRPNYGNHGGHKDLDTPYKFSDFLQFVKKSFALVGNMVNMANQRYGIQVSLDSAQHAMHDLLDDVNRMSDEIDSMNDIIYSCEGYPQDQQHLVMLDRVDGKESVACISPGFWPKFLHVVMKMSTISTDVPTDSSGQLRWIDENQKELQQYATDVYAKLPEWKSQIQSSGANADLDLIIRSYQVSRSYLSSPLKLREREQHRGQSELSQYVPFLDGPLGTQHTSEAGMRTSFPYFLGYALWGVMQTYAEAVVKAPANPENKQMIQDFIDWFQSFKYVHPCPFCKHHLTTEVQFTKEADMYPLEYTLYNLPEDSQVCFDPKRSVNEHVQIDLTKKLSSVLNDSTGREFQIFLWVLHNAVSSSIGRKEEWYPSIQQVKADNRADECGVQSTLRWWPRTDLLQDFATLEQHRQTIFSLYEGLDKNSPNCKPFFQDERIQQAKAEVDALLTKHGDRVADELAKTYGLVESKKEAMSRDHFSASSLDEDLRVCKFQISDSLQISQ